MPLATAWSFAGKQVTTPPVITGGDGPSQQRVAYGTLDGRVHLRTLDTGEPVGPAAGTLVADAPVTDAAGALASGFVSSSSDTVAGILYVVHDDGGGVEIARLDEATGMRVGPDRSVPGSLGCDEVGAPLLTPVAADGTRLLLFTMRGRCQAGEGLVRFGVLADGGLTSPGVAPVVGLAGAPPALVIIDGSFLVAVPRRGGIDFRRPEGRFGAAAELSLDLGATETPVALAATGEDLLILSSETGSARVRRAVLDAQPRLAGEALVPGAPAGLAVSPAGTVAVATDQGLTVLDGGLGTVGTSAGASGPPSIAGAYAYAAGRAVRLGDASAQPLPSTPSVAPAIARGYVVFGATTFTTTDRTPPTLSAHGLTATVFDDRGVAEVTFGGVLAGPLGSPWVPARYRAQLALAPGRNRVHVVARDRAGNAARTVTTVRVGCAHRLQGSGGSDVLRGTSERDCVDGRGGDDVLMVRGGGADRVRCGPGRDTVSADRSDRVADTCEALRRLGP
jgi:hypothetical protein